MDGKVGKIWMEESIHGIQYINTSSTNDINSNTTNVLKELSQVGTKEDDEDQIIEK